MSTRGPWWLVVKDFCLKYVGKEHAQHLKRTLEENYAVTTEWDGKQYIGITLEWDYNRRQFTYQC